MSFLNPILILIALTAGISMYAWSNRALLDNWILSPHLMQQRQQWYRFLTSGFLHADLTHLLFNMYAFYSFSPIVLRKYVMSYGVGAGIGCFLLLYLGGIILSSVPTFFRHRHNPGYHSLGASGGVSSVVFASVLLFPTGEIGLIFLPPQLGLPSFVFGLLYLAYSYYMSRRSADNINHDAHFYGALYGVVVTLALLPSSALDFGRQVQLYLYNML